MAAQGRATRQPDGARRSAGRSMAGAPHEVRIVGGAWKRSRLRVLDRPGLRPTPDRVRETLFNWLGQDLAGWRCLDAYAGSGALGFEAASRGAAEVVLLERDRALVTALDEARLRLKATALRVEAADAVSWMSRAAPARFELVLLDPPFDAGLMPRSLAAAAPLVVPGGFVYLEGPAFVPDEALAALGLAPHRAARAGAVHYQLARRSGEAADAGARADGSAGNAGDAGHAGRSSAAAPRAGAQAAAADDAAAGSGGRSVDDARADAGADPAAR